MAEPFSESSQEQSLRNIAFQLSSFNLVHLDFSHNRGIFSYVISSLCNYYSKIESLNLSYCVPISKNDMVSLGVYLKRTTTLLELNLNSLNLGKVPSGVFRQFLNGLVANSSLKRLHLSTS